MSQKLTVILSEKKSPTRAEKSLLEAIAARLADCDDIHLCIAPSLYDLPAGSEVASRLAKFQRPLVVLGWHHPRAMFWTLAAHGIAGQMGEEAAADMLQQETARTIWCIDLRNQKRADAVVRRVEAIANSLEPSASAGRATAPMQWTDDDPEGHRWYPVVDHDRCRNCLECLNFCLFGVYGLDEGEQLFVEQPDACRDGCPACARVCPASAIMFPMCDDAAIAGAAKEKAKEEIQDSQQTSRRAPQKAVTERRKALVDKANEKAARPVNRRSKAALEKLDGLVDDLEGLDL